MNIKDAVESSRTRYVKFSNTDKEIIEKIKSILKAEHPIYSRPSCIRLYPGDKYYENSKGFYLRIE